MTDPKKENKEFLILVRKIAERQTWEISTRFLLTIHCETYSTRGDLGEEESDDYNERTIKRQANGLAENIFKIEGVQKVVIDQYDVRVTIGHAFKKEEVIPKVMEIISMYIHGDKGQTFQKN